MIRRLIALIALVALLAIPFATTASAVTTITSGLGNPTCEGTKIEPVASGTYALDGGGYIVITVNSTPAGPTFDFDTEGSATVGSVLVKGGPAWTLYSYSPPVTSDDGLHAPVNPNNGKYYGLSHLCIESAKKDDPDPKK